MLAAHFPRTYGEKVEHNHGIIPMMRIGRDGIMRPASAYAPKLEDRSPDLVASADSGEVDPRKMKIGLIVADDLEPGELEQRSSNVCSQLNLKGCQTHRSRTASPTISGLSSPRRCMVSSRPKCRLRRIVRQVALFGAQNRDGWGVGLTILTSLANLLPVFT